MVKVGPKIIERIQDGKKPAHVAKRFIVARSTAMGTVRLWNETGGVSKRTSGGQPRSVRTEDNIKVHMLTP